MTKAPSDYNKGKIYVIRNHINDNLYVGSTTQTLSKRLSYHKSDSQNKKYKLYQAIDELGFENFYIELIENYPCDTKEQLTAREGYFIRLFGTFVNGYNKNIAGRTLKEWFQDNKDEIAKQAKQYYEENKEKILDYGRLYKKNHKEEITKYTKEYNKQYNEKHKEEIKEKNKEYRQDHKEEIAQYKKQKIDCECGNTYTQGHKARHLRTKRHLEATAKISTV